jgi:cytochrome c553
MRWQPLTHLAASALFAMATSACVGEYEMNQPTPGGDEDDDDGTDGDITAEEMFNSTVAEGLRTECGTCHAGEDLDDTLGGPDWLGPDIDSSYATLRGYTSVEGLPLVGPTPGDSQIYYKGAHPPGVALSDALKPKVGEWIAAQALEDGIDPDPKPDEEEPDPETPTGPDTLVEALELFSNCMTYEDFDATNFENVANQNTAEGQCSGCHGQGTGGSFLSANNIDFYVNQRKMPYILKFVTGTVNDDGSFKDLIISRRYELKRDDNGHPNYIMAEERLNSIRDFFDVTYTKYSTAIAAGTPCTPDDPINNPPP